MQGKYISTQTIMAGLARAYKHKEFDIYDIIEWCGEAIKNIANFESFKRYDYRDGDPSCIIQVTNKRALLPCNMHRLLNVYKNCCPVSSTRFTDNGTYLNFPEDNFEINIDYIGVALDKDGFPMIEKSQYQACFWYCTKMIYLEEWINGKLPSDRYQYFDEQYGKYVQKTKSSFENTSHNDMNEYAMIMYNMLPQLKLPRTS